jgi:hypothetical protein
MLTFNLIIRFKMKKLIILFLFSLPVFCRGQHVTDSLHKYTDSFMFYRCQVNGQIIKIFFGGTITTGAAVTALTISANSGQTIIGSAVTAAAGVVGSPIIYQFNNATGYWYRQQ